MKIAFTRGDTAKFSFQRKDVDGAVITTPASEIYFTVKENSKNLTPVLQKTMEDMTFDDDGTYHFELEPADTNGLSFCKKYWYDIEVIDVDVKTTIAYDEFILKPEVTWQANELGESE